MANPDVSPLYSCWILARKGQEEMGFMIRDCLTLRAAVVVARRYLESVYLRNVEALETAHGPDFQPTAAAFRAPGWEPWALVPLHAVMGQSLAGHPALAGVFEEEEIDRKIARSPMLARDMLSQLFDRP